MRQEALIGAADGKSRPEALLMSVNLIAKAGRMLVLAPKGTRMPRLATVVEHAATTNRTGYRYRFTPKHHGRDKKAAQWLPDMTLDEEFAVFDLADQHDVSSEDGSLYGLWPDGQGGLNDIGTWGQQVAEFPAAGENEPWRTATLCFPSTIERRRTGAGENCSLTERSWKNCLTPN
jgi:hypothetical protein